MFKENLAIVGCRDEETKIKISKTRGLEESRILFRDSIAHLMKGLNRRNAAHIGSLILYGEAGRSAYLSEVVKSLNLTQAYIVVDDRANLETELVKVSEFFLLRRKKY